MTIKILTRQQIKDLEALDPSATFLGKRVNYLFMHEDPPAEKRGVCGLYGFIVSVKEESDANPPRFSIAFDTTIDDFFVVQHGFHCLVSPVQQEPGILCVVDFSDFAEIMDSVFPSWDAKTRH